jgi:hypothetical protein
MDEDDLAEISSLLNVENNNTIILLFLRGEYSEELTSEKQDDANSIISTRIRNKSIF